VTCLICDVDKSHYMSEYEMSISRVTCPNLIGRKCQVKVSQHKLSELEMLEFVIVIARRKKPPLSCDNKIFRNLNPKVLDCLGKYKKKSFHCFCTNKIAYDFGRESIKILRQPFCLFIEQIIKGIS
jgi:hypothetical protein